MARVFPYVLITLAAWALASPAAAGPPRRPTDWIAFEPRPGGRVVLPIRIDGRQTMALLDNGASRTVIDTAYAESIGLRAHGAYPNNGGVGRQTSSHVDGVRIGAGGLELEHLSLASLDLAATGKTVILGDEAFDAAVVDIDFARHRIAFRDPARFVAPHGAVEVPLIRDGDLRLVPVSIEGRPPVLFEFDLGAAGTIVVSPAYAAQAHLLDGRPTSQGLLFGVGGEAAETRAVLRQVSFAGVGFDEVDAHFPQAWPAGTFSGRVKGVLGATILSRFHLIVDYRRERLYAFPNADGP